MSSYISLHLRHSDVQIRERFEKDSMGKKYATLHIEEADTNTTVFLDKIIARKLLNVVRRIDRRLNQ